MYKVGDYIMVQYNEKSVMGFIKKVYEDDNFYVIEDGDVERICHDNDVTYSLIRKQKEKYDIGETVCMILRDKLIAGKVEYNPDHVISFQDFVTKITWSALVEDVFILVPEEDNKIYQINDEVFYYRDGKVYRAKIAGKEEIEQYLIKTDEFTCYAHPDDIYTSQELSERRARNNVTDILTQLITALNNNASDYDSTLTTSDSEYDYATSIRAKDGEYELIIKKTRFDI